MQPYLIFVPVIWTVVAVVAGLVLYKTGDAAWVKESADNTDTKQTRQRLVLGGSVLIAAGTFWGLYKVTPIRLMEPIPPGWLLIEKSKLSALHDAADGVHTAAKEMEKGALSVQGCVVNRDWGTCKSDVQELTERAAGIAEKSRALVTRANAVRSETSE